VAKVTKTILIVEDEQALSKALQLKLAHNGFDTTCTANGEEGLKLIEEKKFDIVLLDLIMPKIDGFKVLEVLRNKKNIPPIIVLSNLSQNNDEDRAKKLGAVDFFVKSNTPIADIVARVAAHLK
jgi:DNA-binding response OmpR family regulator